MARRRNRIDATGRHAAELARAGQQPADDPAESDEPTPDAPAGDSSEWTGRTLVAGSRNTPPPERLGLPETGPTRPWLVKSAGSAEPAPQPARPVVVPPPAADEAPRKTTRDRRPAPSEPGTVLQLLAADIGPAASGRPVRMAKTAAVTQAPLGGRVAETAPAAPAASAAPAAPPQVDAVIVLAAERRLEDLSRRLNDVEHRAESERQAALHRLAAAEQRAGEYEQAHGTLWHAHNDLAQRHDEAIRELDTAVGLLAEEVGRREEFEQQAHNATSLLAAERRAKQDIVQQSNVEHQALAARLKSVEKRLVDAVQQASVERAEHRRLLERAQGALTAEAQARTAAEDQLAEMSRAAEVLQAQQTAEISRLNIALQAAIDRRVEFEARLAEMEAGNRAQRDAEARSWVGAEQRLAETIAALESDRVRGEQWRQQTATEVQQQLREALGALSGSTGKHSDAGEEAAPPGAERPHPRPRSG
jgi:hypothetical protein